MPTGVLLYIVVWFIVFGMILCALLILENDKNLLIVLSIITMLAILAIIGILAALVTNLIL